MGIHLHCGAAGTYDGVAALVYSGTNYDGVAALLWDVMASPPQILYPKVEGVLESTDVQDMVCEGKQLNTIASLYQAIRNGSIFLSIESQAYPGGVARGQIFL